MATTSINLDNLNGSNGFKFAGSNANPVSVLGDINGDGIDDIAIADPRADSFGGVVYIVFGSSDGFPATLTPDTVDVTIMGGTAGIRAGFSVSGVGDFNGDDIEDFLIGGPSADPGGRTDAGQSYLVFGTSDGFPQQLDLQSLDGTNGFQLNGVTGAVGVPGASGFRAGDLSGFSVSGAGDVNGDGLTDLLIGGPQSDFFGAGDSNLSLSGVAYVVFGTTDPVPAEFELSSLDGSNGFKLEGKVPGGGVGWSVSSAGDLNGDGFDEVIIGGPQNEVGFTGGPGSPPTYAYIVYGSDMGFAPTIELTTPQEQTGDVAIVIGNEQEVERGLVVSGAGDINGDGFDDVIVNSFKTDFSASVVFGAADKLPLTTDVRKLNGTDGFRVNTGENGFPGTWLTNVGDVNNDGFEDILVGQPQASQDPQTGVFQGAAYLIFGTDQGFPAEIDAAQLDGTDGLILNTGIDPSLELGISVSGAGDVNGDGIADMIIGTRADGQTTPSAYIVFGSSDLGASLGLKFVGDDRNDKFVGKEGKDLAFGGAGRDLLIGRDDDDFLFGGGDDDILKGGRDNDVLRGGLGRDIKKGGPGDDTYIGTAEELDGDRIIGFRCDDELIIEGYDGEVEIERSWFGRTEILFDTDDNGSLDGSLLVKGVFGRRSFEVDQVEGDTIITLEGQGPLGGFFSGFAEKFFDGWDFF